MDAVRPSLHKARAAAVTCGCWLRERLRAARAGYQNGGSARIRYLLRFLHINAGVLFALTLGLIALSTPYMANKDKYKGTVWEGPGKALKEIHTGKFLPKTYRPLWINSQGLALLGLVASGWWMHRKPKAAPRLNVDGSQTRVTLLYGSANEKAELLARKFADTARSRGLDVQVGEANAITPELLQNSRWLFVIVGSYVQGGPPPCASEFYERLRAEDFPKLPKTEYAVFGLGDERYVQTFCAFPICLDRRLSELGAKRFAASVNAGSQHEQLFDAWSKGVLHLLEARQAMPLIPAENPDHETQPA